MRFEGTAEYVATADLMVAVNAAIRLERPLLVERLDPGNYPGSACLNRWSIR